MEGLRRLTEINERRKARRLRALKGGTIAFNRAASIDCRVHNMSPVGACLEVASQIGIPDEFVLVVGYDKTSTPCHVGVRMPAWVSNSAPLEAVCALRECTKLPVILASPIDLKGICVCCSATMLCPRCNNYTNFG